MNLIPTTKEPSLRRWLLAQLMRLINANPTGYWYRWKDILLHLYGEEDGFDTQRLEAPCWTCGGAGDCYDCDEGIHHVTRTKLWRWTIEGFVFHRPDEAKIYTDSELNAIERWAQEGLGAPWHSRIIGRVRHRPTPACVSREAEAWLLLMLGRYKTLGQWFGGAGSSHLKPCAWLPLSAIRALVITLKHLPANCRRAWRHIQNRKSDIPF